jgi:hypothetical protein
MVALLWPKGPPEEGGQLVGLFHNLRQALCPQLISELRAGAVGVGLPPSPCLEWIAALAVLLQCSVLGGRGRGLVTPDLLQSWASSSPLGSRGFHLLYLLLFPLAQGAEHECDLECSATASARASHTPRVASVLVEVVRAQALGRREKRVYQRQCKVLRHLYHELIRPLLVKYDVPSDLQWVGQPLDLGYGAVRWYNNNNNNNSN